MGKCKSKAIQTDLGTFMHNQAYPGIIQVYSKPCITWHIQRHGIFRTLTHSKSETYSDIFSQDLSIFRTLAYSKSKAYSDIYYIKHL